MLALGFTYIYSLFFEEVPFTSWEFLLGVEFCQMSVYWNDHVVLFFINIVYYTKFLDVKWPS